MEWFEALILGLIQGLTEFLPVSSSGHLEIGKAIFGITGEENLYFTIVVHGATVLSTIVVLWQEIRRLITGSLKFTYNEETKTVLKILVSMIPVGIVGVFFKEDIKQFFDGNNMPFVGSMLLITAALLAFTHVFKNRSRQITYSNAFVIGIAQAFAVLPGISRSGATIATGLMLGNKRENVAKFSFLMVLLPIIGENLLDIISGDLTGDSSMQAMPLIIGFLAAFVSGYIACRWMLNIVKKGNLFWFAIYCAVIGVVLILFM
ncbi:MAG: undecaprenyl-diphosphate phosphatase [Candidatus Delongbacteria bacterium]|jgi:undecaprenyl-diphosphatase|nr:undecaprenyl-diphosphate phosphatase [Candidatus Delongbacteria bacterium]